MLVGKPDLVAKSISTLISQSNSVRRSGRYITRLNNTTTISLKLLKEKQMFRVKFFENICYCYAFPHFDPERNDPKTNPTERT